jgi:hypothetical protein
VRFVLVEGLHRLEAAKALGEKTIVSFLVDAPKHRRAGAFIRMGDLQKTPKVRLSKKAKGRALVV